MRTLPLITDLQSPAMRPRHWEELSKVVGSPLNPHSPTFTLDTLVGYHMEQHATLIGSMSADASRQVAIEQTLQVRLLSQGEQAPQFCIECGRL